MAIVLLIAGIFFLFYFILIAFFVGHGTNFFFIWLLLGLVCVCGAFLLHRGKIPTLPLWLHRGTVIAVSLGVMLFVFVQGCIISEFASRGPKDLDYIIVLGAQMKNSGPSRVLKMRLDAAYDYLIENEHTIAVLSGGQGADEPVSEAQGMYEYLTQRGISGERLVLEDQSVNTSQNLRFSGALLDKQSAAVGIVTNNFHVFRAKRIAVKAGYMRVYGIAAKAENVMQLNNMTREFLGVVKDFLAGNL